MHKLTQSRTGKTGTCFRTCLASLLNLREDQVPDFKDANANPEVDRFLARYGLRYDEVPVDQSPIPTGYHIITGLSPRGGEHAVVGYQGRIVMDPHPHDGTGRGLVKEKMWGELLPVLRREVKDSKAAEALRARHDEIVSNHLRGAGSSAETAYNALYRPTVSLVRDAEVLLTKTRLDDDPAYWHRKLESAQDHLDEAVRLTKSGKYGQATSYLDAALTMAHTVIDKMRKTGRAKDMDVKGHLYRENSRIPGKCLLCGQAKWAHAANARRAQLHHALDCVLDRKVANDGGKVAYVKNRLYADKVSPDLHHTIGGKWLNPGKELTSFDASDKGVMFKDAYGTVYHIDFYDCDKNLSARKPR